MHLSFLYVEARGGDRPREPRRSSVGRSSVGHSFVGCLSVGRWRWRGYAFRPSRQGAWGERPGTVYAQRCWLLRPPRPPEEAGGRTQTGSHRALPPPSASRQPRQAGGARKRSARKLRILLTALAQLASVLPDGPSAAPPPSHGESQHPFSWPAVTHRAVRSATWELISSHVPSPTSDLLSQNLHL